MRTKERKQKQKRVRRRNAFRMKANAANHIDAELIPNTSNATQTVPVKKRKRNIPTLREILQSVQNRSQFKQNISAKIGKNTLGRDMNPTTCEVENSHNSPKTSTANTTDMLTNGTPTPTVYSPARKRKKFRKFRGNQKRQRPLPRNPLNSTNETTTSNQIITRKLLRSIKRRQQKSLNVSQQRKRYFVQKQKSNLQDNTPKKLRLASSNASLEEGEIISDEEEPKTNTVTTKSVEDNDDDCVCIEPEIEEIVIEDDTPSTSRLSSGYASIINRMGDMRFSKLLTSTPLSETKALTTAAKTTNTKEKTAPIFYEDLLRRAWFETINSDDTFADYTKQIITRRGSGDGDGAANLPKRTSKTVNVSHDIIVLDDSRNDETLRPAVTQSKEMDDSVIFISETQVSSPALDFIPLVSDKVPNPLAMPVNVRTPRKPKAQTNLFTTSEKKQLDAYNSNTYNPSADAMVSRKRLIIIDGSNVAYQHSLNKEFSIKGLKICIDYFEKMGHEVKAVVPQFRLHKCSDPNEMERLHKSGKIVLTPCKNLPGKFTISYDDRFVLQLASEMDAVIISNDNYRDLINENSAFKKLIENRVVGFTWCNDIFMVAKDPYGKWGPSLQVILNRS